MPPHEGDALAAAACRAASEGPEPLLEVGSYCGKSTLYLVAGVIEAAAASGGAPSVLYSLDHHRGSEELQEGWADHDRTLVDERIGLLETLPHWRENIRAAGVEELVVGLIGDSPRVADAWSTPLRFLFIDGGHGEVPAWADYRGWAPKLVTGGFLAIHDVFESPAAGGRPPYEIYRRALESGAFCEIEDAGEGSLRVLMRSGVGL